MKSRTKRVSGVIVPMITPFSSSADLIDESAVTRTVEHLIVGGASIFLLGTTGESCSIPTIPRRRLVALVKGAVNQRTPIYAGISSNCLTDSLEDAACWADLGVDAAVAHLPSYYPIDGEQMFRYYEALADGLSLPLILYNIPSTTHHSLPLEIAERLSQHPNIIGLKDSERDLERLEASIRLWKDRADFSFLIGWAAQSAYALRLGADGLVPSTGNFAPGLYRRIYEASLSGDVRTATDLQALTNEFSGLYQHNRNLSRSLAALKGLMSELGLCQANVQPPLLPLTEEERQVIRQEIQNLSVREWVLPSTTGGPDSLPDSSTFSAG